MIRLRTIYKTDILVQWVTHYNNFMFWFFLFAMHISGKCAKLKNIFHMC